MPKIVIDSRHRTNLDDGAENYELNLSKSIKVDDKVILEKVIFPKGIYPVNAHNNIVPVWNGTTLNSVTLTAGNYTATSLATEFQTQLRSLTGDATITVTYSSTTGVLTVDGGVQVTLDFDYTRGTAEVDWNQDSAFLLGLDPNGANVNGSGVSPVTYTNLVDLSYPKYLFMDLNFHEDYGEGIVSYRSSHTFILPLSNVSWGSISEFNINNEFLQGDHFNQSSISKVGVKFYFHDGNTSDLSFNGLDHVIILRIV